MKRRVGGSVDTALVKEVLRYLAWRGVYLTTTRSQKLLYLVERQCILDTGERCMRLEFRYDQFGMYSPTLKGIFLSVNTQTDDLRLGDIESQRGQGRAVYWVGGDADFKFPYYVEEAVNLVLAHYGFLNTPTLIREAKKTSPFVHAKKGEHLDWKLLKQELRKEEQLSEEGEERLKEAWKSIQAGKHRRYDDVESLMAGLFAD